jgi:hypothetical protein
MDAAGGSLLEQSMTDANVRSLLACSPEGQRIGSYRIDNDELVGCCNRLQGSQKLSVLTGNHNALE